MKVKSREVRLRGVSVSRGIAIGKPFFLSSNVLQISERRLKTEEVDLEVDRFQEATKQAGAELVRLQKRMQKQGIYQGMAVLDTQVQMMRDPILTVQIEQAIRSSKRNAEYVLSQTIRSYEAKFNAISDQFFRERFKDLQDISQRILNLLREKRDAPTSSVPSAAIIFAHELVVSNVVELDPAFQGALVVSLDSVASHAAIVAKARAIPYVSGIDHDELMLDTETTVIVDGRTGELILNPSSETLALYEKLQKRLTTHFQHLEQLVDLVPETYDGYKVQLSANIGAMDELEMMHEYGGDGVGLFRSENLFLSGDGFPSEEEQFIRYRDLVKSMKGLPMVIRTFDIGGDKLFMGGADAANDESPLGCRAIRFLLQKPKVFKDQLAAILRASAYGSVKILFPMISGLSELLQAKELIEEVRADLKRRDEPFAKKVPVGCMIEVPSAAIISDLLAAESDFLSIGTNDLVQYSLAVDRTDPSLGVLYSPTHPSVIRQIRLSVLQANQSKTPVTVCGEVAADPRFTALLLGLGVHELSVAARHIPLIKHVIRNISIVQSSQLVDKVLSLTMAEEIEALLSEQYQRVVPDDCLYNI